MSILLSALQQAAQAHRAAVAAQQSNFAPPRVSIVQRPEWMRFGGVVLLGMAGGAVIVMLVLFLTPRQSEPLVKTEQNRVILPPQEPVVAVAPQQVQEELPGPVVKAIADQIAPYVEPKKTKAEPRLQDKAKESGEKPAGSFSVDISRKRGGESTASVRDQGGAAAALARGEYQNALAAYDAILRYDPQNKEALIGRATALQQSGASSVAMPVWRLLHQRYPDDAAIATSYAVALGAANPERARRILQDILQRQPRYAPALTAKAALDVKVGDLTAAQTAQEQAWAQERENPSYRLNLAILADKRGDQQQALALYRQAQNAYLKSGGSAALPATWPGIQARMAYLERALAGKAP